MANRVLITDLPKYPVCTVSELLNGSPSAHSTVHADHSNRRIVKLPNKREIIVVLHPLTNEIFAMDRFCYHDGYPLESGDIEDIGVVESMESDATAKKSQAERNARRGEGQVIPRQKGALKFNKEEHVRTMSKLLRQNEASSNSNNNNSEEIEKKSENLIINNDLLKLIQPGKLEVDFENPAQFHDDDTYCFPIITCTLHNRIFDFRTGDMVSRAVVRRPVKTPRGKNDTEEEEKCLVTESTGCHQRIHPISIERIAAGNSEEKEDFDGVVFFYDTYGYSVPMRRPGTKVNMDDRSHLMFLAKKKVLSDKENKVVEEQKK